MTTIGAPFMAVSEVATALHISRTRAYELVRDGQVPATRFGGCIRVPRRAFNQWLADRETEALASLRSHESPEE